MGNFIRHNVSSVSSFPVYFICIFFLGRKKASPPSSLCAILNANVHYQVSCWCHVTYTALMFPIISSITL